MSHTYRYIFDDAISKQKLGTLPLYGVSCSDFLSIGAVRAGQFTGTIRMDNDLYSVQQILDWTNPDRVRVWVERDDRLIWGGLVWTRTYQSDGRSMQITAQSFASYPASVILRDNIADAAVDWNDKPYNIIRGVWMFCTNALPAFAPTPSYYDIGVVLEPYHADLTSSTESIVVRWANGEDKFLQEYVADMLKGDAEFRIRVAYDSSGTRTATFESSNRGGLGSPASQVTNKPVWKYPGAISKYFMTDSTTEAGHLILGLGSRQGSSQLEAVASHLPTGIGRNVLKRYETDSYTALQAYADADMAFYNPPMQNPVYQLAGDNIDMSFELGDYRRIVIDDPYRYPNGVVVGDVRILGWQLSPAESDGVETLSITIDDGSRLVPQS